jgi:hypothetical protein
VIKKRLGTPDLVIYISEKTLEKVLENEREIANIFTPPQKDIKRDAPPQEAIGKRERW